jgi:hypothetical protein
MPFSIRPLRRSSVQCSVTYNAGPFKGQGTIWNLSCSGWRLSGDLPMRPGETLSLTVKLPNEQHIFIPDAVVRWSRGEEFKMSDGFRFHYSGDPARSANFQGVVARLSQ